VTSARLRNLISPATTAVVVQEAQPGLVATLVTTDDLVGAWG
jgi:hypothetical protein